MSVSAGTYTVGVGGDYVDWVAAAADTIALTGDLTFVQISDLTITARALWRFACNGYKLHLTSDKFVAGDPANSWTTSVNLIGDNAAMELTFGTNATRNTYIDSLSFKWLGGSGGTSFFIVWNLPTVATPSVINISDCMFDCNGFAVGAFNTVNVGGSAAGSSYIFNHLIWGWINGATVWPIQLRQPGDVLENCTLYSSGLGTKGILIDCATQIQTRNNAVFTVSTAFTWTNGAGNNALSMGNASSDATSEGALTQSNNLINQVAATCFSSLAPGAGFLVPIVGGTLQDAGVAPVIANNTLGIEGNPRPDSGGNYSVGAYQYAIPAPSFQGAFMPIFLPGV